MTAKSKPNTLLDQALARLRAGDAKGAEAGFRAVLKQDPDHPDGLVLLGNVLRETKRAGEAIPLIERAIEAAPKRGRKPDPAWTVMLGMARRDSGDFEGALADVQSILDIASGSIDLIVIRAGILQRLERHEEAVRDYRTVGEKRPPDSQILHAMGRSLQILGRLREAYEAFNRAVEISPNYVPAIGATGELLRDMGQMEAAIAMFRRACALEPQNRAAERALIDGLQVGEQAAEAERLAEKVLARDPDDLEAMVSLGNIRMVMGNRQSATDLARRARELKPRAPGVLSLLAEADREIDAASLLGEIDTVLAESQAANQGIGLHFSAAKLCEKLKKYPEAFAHYVAGNAVRREQLQRLEASYDRARVEKLVDDLIAAFRPESFSGPTGSTSELPVFIVGMPRSGTTLTEQILASHPRAVGAGELGEISQIVRWLRGAHGYPGKLSAGNLKEAASGYLKHVGKIGRGADRVTDKMPGNFMHLGLIARMFPNTRIIHCRRDPMDNLLSCFAQNFRADGLGWSCDLEDAAHQYAQYRRITDHWRRVLPPGMLLEIDYENTVADLEGQARKLVDFIGLPWDAACLRFHETERAVATASREQVRNPIYNSSVGRWKRYGDGVLPLVRALAEQGIAVEA